MTPKRHDPIYKEFLKLRKLLKHDRRMIKRLSLRVKPKPKEIKP